MKKHILSLIIVCFSTSFYYGQVEQIDQVDLSGVLQTSFMVDMVEDANGVIWGLHSFIGAGLETGLMKYDGTSWQTAEFPCATCLRDLELNADGTKLYAAADTEGVYELNEQGMWEQITTTTALNIAVTSNGDLKIVNTSGVFTFNGNDVAEGNNEESPNFFALSGFEIDQNDQLWLLTGMSLYTYTDSEGWILKTEAVGPVLIEYAPDGKLWIAANTGVFSYFEDGSFYFNQIKNVFPSGQRAAGLHIDNSNTFWVGVQGDTPGMVMHNNDETKEYSAQQLTGSSNPIDFSFVTSEGEVWAFENYNNVVAHIYESQLVDEDQDGFTNDIDCDDSNAAINPDAEEIPNNDIDENCDGEMLVIDEDQDGFNSDVDCDDSNAAINPDAEEIPNNDIDENCDGEMLVIDEDQDGFNSDVDCDDSNSAINPDAEEIPNNDIDENCDGEMLVIDEDQDGFNSDVDCDDSNAAINPDAEEIPNNDIDENCDGVDLTSSIEEELDIYLKISPNPSNGNSRISFSETLQNPTVSIVSLDGQVINRFDCTRPIAHFDINTSNFTAGVYIVNVTSLNKVISEKLFVE